jgi:transcriptional regulator with XRE-family HTH domain
MEYAVGASDQGFVRSHGGEMGRNQEDDLPGSELGLDGVETKQDLGRVLRRLKRRRARQTNEKLTVRYLEAELGYSRASINAYFAGKTLPPIDKLDDIVGFLGATDAEKKAFAEAWERIEDSDPGSGMASADPPRQLPGASSRFVGRERELKALTDLLPQTSGDGSTVVISAIEGMPGIGKTALAICWSHQVADQFPDGHLYVNLCGFDPTGRRVGPAEALRGFLAALHVPPERIPIKLDRLVAEYRSILAGKRILVVLDNAYDIEAVRPLLPGSPTCTVVVTSRNELTGLIADGAHLVLLGLLTGDEARELLIRHLGYERVEREPQAVDGLITRCARLPLALTVVAARAALRPTSPLTDFCAELNERGLDALDTGDPATTVETVFSWSYSYLGAHAQRMFRLLGIHFGPDISLSAAASLAGLSPEDARRALVELTRAHLAS